jgi:hypothetical protein
MIGTSACGSYIVRCVTTHEPIPMLPIAVRWPLVAQTDSLRCAESYSTVLYMVLEMVESRSLGNKQPTQ